MTARAFAADARVGIVGGGASGLAVAHALRELGYRHVTVLEREPCVGGKCCTLAHRGRTYELGAALVTPAYRDVRALMREVGVVGATRGGAALRVGLRDGSPLRPWASRTRSGMGSAVDLARFGFELCRHHRVFRPGFAGLSEELALPFDDWIRARHCEAARDVVEPWFTAFGYGALSEVPAAYVLKYATLFRFPLLELPDGGYGGLFERVARALGPVDVRLGVRVIGVTRDARGVTVRTTDETLRFDALVLACPLDEALAFLDATDLETDLFERIRYQAYFVLGGSVSGRLPGARYTFFRENFDPALRGQPVFAYRRWPASNVVFFYGFARAGDWETSARRDVARAVERLGGRLDDVIALRNWRYFPHVGTDDMAAGFYRRLEALQGERRTYYCGELLAFATVETVVEYARAVIHGHFALCDGRA